MDSLERIALLNKLLAQATYEVGEPKIIVVYPTQRELFDRIADDLLPHTVEYRDDCPPDKIYVLDRDCLNVEEKDGTR